MPSVHYSRSIFWPTAIRLQRCRNCPSNDQCYDICQSSKTEDADLFLVCVHDAGQNGSDDPVSVTDERVEQLKRDYSDVLCTAQPEGLPPSRPTVPTIPLVNESLTVFQQMYRLSPAEKSELQKQIEEFLHRGLNRPSASPIGSLILSSKRKMGPCAW